MCDDAKGSSYILIQKNLYIGQLHMSVILLYQYYLLSWSAQSGVREMKNGQLCDNMVKTKCN